MSTRREHHREGCSVHCCEVSGGNSADVDVVNQGDCYSLHVKLICHRLMWCGRVNQKDSLCWFFHSNSKLHTEGRVH